MNYPLLSLPLQFNYGKNMLIFRVQIKEVRGKVALISFNSALEIRLTSMQYVNCEYTDISGDDKLFLIDQYRWSHILCITSISSSSPLHKTLRFYFNEQNQIISSTTALDYTVFVNKY